MGDGHRKGACHAVRSDRRRAQRVGRLRAALARFARSSPIFSRASIPTHSRTGGSKTSGRLAPPFGLSCFVIKAAIDRSNVSLNDVFAGAFPFAAVMLLVLIVLIAFPQITLEIL